MSQSDPKLAQFRRRRGPRFNNRYPVMQVSLGKLYKSQIEIERAELALAEFQEEIGRRIAMFGDIEKGPLVIKPRGRLTVKEWNVPYRLVTIPAVTQQDMRKLRDLRKKFNSAYRSWAHSEDLVRYAVSHCNRIQLGRFSVGFEGSLEVERHPFA
jgi:hypothetical protein